MSNYYCSCKDDNILLELFKVKDCSACNLDVCKKKNNRTTNVKCQKDEPIFGLNIKLFLIIVCIQILIWVVLIFISIKVLRKCKNQLALKVIIIVLLLLWIILSWIPFLGFVLFVILGILLIIYNKNCKENK